MKFYSEIPNEIYVGGPDKVAFFVDGECETNDKDLIKILQEAGYGRETKEVNPGRQKVEEKQPEEKASQEVKRRNTRKG